MKTQKISLRALEKTDAEILQKAFSNPEMIQYMTPEAMLPLSRTEEEGLIDELSKPETKESKYTFGVENPAGKLVGICGYLNTSHKNRRCVIGLAILDPKDRGKGYGTASLRALLDFLFLEKNMRKVSLNVFAFNPRAIACYKKIGFKEEGCLREHIYRAGKYHDNIVMAIFKRDYCRP